jgi:DNA-binding transcriptional LysR family regulator
MLAPVQGLRWDDVHLFLTLVREKSLGAAAKRLALDTSTASRRLARMEETLGRRLFERTREGLVATHAATRMLPAAEEMERGLKHLTATAGSIQADVEGVVRIACPPGLADTFLVPMLAELRRRHPALTFEIDAGIRPVDLARHEADLALRSIRPDSAELVIVKLVTSRSILVASPELAAKLSPVRAWADLPWIFWGHDLDHIPIPRWCAKHVPRVVPVLRTSAMGAQLRAAQLGLGVCFVPEHYAPPAGLVPLEISRKLSADAATWPVDDLYLVCHRSVRNAPRVAAVWDHLVAAFRAV